MSDRIIRLGGSNIGNTSSINNLAGYLSKSNERKFVVVSAVPGLLNFISEVLENIFHKELPETEIISLIYAEYSLRLGDNPSVEYKKLAGQLVALLKGIALIGDYSKALKDQVLSFAEKLSVEILKSQWDEIQIIYPEEIKLNVTSDFGNATFISVSKEIISNLPDAVYAIPGTYGITETGKIARTGSTAADYTAAFLTAYLGAEKLELWGIDNDFQKADPRIVPDSPKIERLTYSEASELAYFDHYSFHPRTVEPLEDLHVPIYVLKTSTNEGLIETKINTETFIDEKIVKSVACSDDISLLKLDGPGVGLKPGILARVTTCLNDAGINIKSVITSQISINLILERTTGDKGFAINSETWFYFG
jgi:bifunctional aspartokinase / homoserine dehydrogenase 1